MRILVIDDKAGNQEAARQTIVGHDLVVVGSYDEALKALDKDQYDEEAIKAKLIAAGHPPTDKGLYDRWSNRQSEAWYAWHKTCDEIKKTCRVSYWDVVLCDLLMPASQESMGDAGMKFVGQEMPVGMSLALLAALNGAKYVAVVTATNHHHHPASAMLDRLGGSYWKGNEQEPNFVINGAAAMFVHAPFISDPVKDVECYNCLGGTACGYCRTKLFDGKCPKLHEGEGHAKPCSICRGKGRYDTHVHERKNWGKVLARLLGQEIPKEE